MASHGKSIKLKIIHPNMQQYASKSQATFISFQHVMAVEGKRLVKSV